MKNFDDFISKSGKIHKNYYDYSKVIFTKMREKVIIICPIHGEFEQVSGNHMNGSGCPKCDIEKRRNKQRDLFIIKSNKIHNNFYDYSKVKYINIKTKIKIICPIHGEFEQVPQKHLINGCNKCHKCNNNKNTFQDTKGCKKLEKDFISKADKIHNNFYDYSKVKYINIKTKIKIICPIHGEFEQSPNNHLSRHGCKKCGLEKRKLDENKFIEKCTVKHNNLYDYSKVKYISSSSKIKIICPIHGEFEQIASSHLFGSGCKKCSILKNGILKYKDRKTLLYFIFFPLYNVYKVGLTRKNINKRFSNEIKRGIVHVELFSKTFPDGSDAFIKEQYILEKFNKYKYKGNIFLETGNSELFTSEIKKHLDKINSYINTN